MDMRVLHGFSHAEASSVSGNYASSAGVSVYFPFCLPKFCFCRIIMIVNVLFLLVPLPLRLFSQVVLLRASCLSFFFAFIMFLTIL